MNQCAADLHRLAVLDVDLQHFAGMRTGNLDRGLVGFQLDNALILLDDVPFVNQHFQHVAGVDVVAKSGKFDIDGHFDFGLWISE